MPTVTWCFHQSHPASAVCPLPRAYSPQGRSSPGLHTPVPWPHTVASRSGLLCQPVDSPGRTGPSSHQEANLCGQAPGTRRTVTTVDLAASGDGWEQEQETQGRLGCRMGLCWAPGSSHLDGGDSSRRGGQMEACVWWCNSLAATCKVGMSIPAPAGVLPAPLPARVPTAASVKPRSMAQEHGPGVAPQQTRWSTRCPASIKPSPH